jgi:cystathionine beta-lyase/cystathionine gamma-synthase
MYLAKIYDPGAREHRVRYAITSILRDRVVNEGAFKVCFDMGDEDAVIRTILRRGLRNLKLRTALERSHLINLTHWFTRYPDLAEAYYSAAARTSGEDSARRSSLRRT